MGIPRLCVQLVMLLKGNSGGGTGDAQQSCGWAGMLESHGNKCLSPRAAAYMRINKCVQRDFCQVLGSISWPVKLKTRYLFSTDFTFYSDENLSLKKNFGHDKYFTTVRKSRDLKALVSLG